MPLDFNSYRAYQLPVQPAKGPIEIAQEVANLKDTQALAQQRQVLLQERQAKAQQDARDQQENQQIQQAIQASGGDMDAAIQQAYTISPEKAGKMAQTYYVAQKSRADLAKTIGDSAASALALYDPNDPTSWGHTQAAVSSIYKTVGMPVPQEYQGPPPTQDQVDRWKQSHLSVIDQLEKAGNAKPEFYSLNGKTVLGRVTHDGRVIVGGQDVSDQVQPVEKPQKEAAAGSPANQAIEQWTAEHGRPPTYAERLQIQKQWGQADDRPLKSSVTVNTGGPVQTDPAVMARIAGLTPEALDQSAIRYHEDGTLPSRYGEAAKKQIQNRAAQMFPGSNLAANTAQYGADRASLRTTQGILDSIQAFHPAALANLKQFDNLFSKISDTGSPFFNAPVRSLDRKLFGADNVLAAQTAVAVATREIARITSNPKLTGQLSDHAREEVANFLPADATLKEARDVMNVLKADLDNVEKGQRDQLKKIQYRISHPGEPIPDESSKTQTGGYQVGQVVTVKGQKVKITNVLPNGQFQGLPVQ